MKAGRKLDARVAEEVMGEHNVHKEGEAWAGVDNKWHTDYMGTLDGKRRVVPNYSTDIAAAWEVVEKLFERYGVEVYGGPQDEGLDYYVSVVGSYVGSYGYREFQDQEWEAWADTAPHAICLAALKVAGVEVEDV